MTEYNNDLRKRSSSISSQNEYGQNYPSDYNCDKHEQKTKFMLKTISTLALQFSFTFVTILLVTLSDSLRLLMLENASTFLFVSAVGSIGTVLYAAFNKEHMTENMLGFFTVMESLLLCVFVSLFEKDVILFSLVITLGLVTGLGSYAMNTKNNHATDESFQYLSSGLTTLVVMGLMNLFLGNSFVETLCLFGGTLLFMGYIVFDIQLYFKNPEVHTHKNAHVMAALNIYLDVVNIFIRIVKIYDKYIKEKNNK